jgi:hypothetical protein
VRPATPSVETTSDATWMTGRLGHVVPKVEEGRTC